MPLTNSIDFSQVNQALGDLKNVSDLSATADKMLNSAKNLVNVKSTPLGSKVDEVVGGIQSLVQEVDYLDPNSLIENLGVAKITSELEGFSDLQKIPTGPVILEALTGLSSELSSIPIQLNQIITSPAPASIAANLESVIGKLPNASALSKLSGNSIDALSSVTDMLGSLTTLSQGIGGIEDKFKNAAATFESQINNNLADVKGGIINRLLENTNPVIGNEITSLSKGLLNASEQLETLQNVLNGRNDIVSDLISEKISKAFPLDDISVLQGMIGLLDPSITNMVNSGSLSVQKKTLGNRVSTKTEQAWKNPDEKYVFTRIHSYEEIISEFRGATREISEVVVHWSATYINQNIGAEEIDQWHKARDFSGIGYHYVIRRDGSLQRGRPLNEIGAHAKTGGHNNFSVGICLVGGYNCASGTKNPDQFANSTSVNNAQWASLKNFLRAFYSIHPGGQVWGHNDTDPDNKIDPGISMENFVFKHFKKRNISIEGRKSSISPSVIATGIRDVSVSSAVAPQTQEVIEPKANTRDGPFVGSQYLATAKGFSQHASYPEIYDFQYVTEDWKDASRYPIGKKFTEYTGHQFYEKGFDTNVYQIWEHIVGSTGRRILVQISDPATVARYAEMERSQGSMAKLNRG